jgi:hypothetical protein
MPRKQKWPRRASPSTREGKRFKPVMLHESTLIMLREISKFQQKSMSSIVRGLVEPLYAEVYKQAEVLARIEANRKSQENEIQNATVPRRRYYV